MGCMIKNVKNNAIPVKTKLGGFCCVPNELLTKDNTTIIRVKLVVNIKNVGAKLSKPISTYNFTTSDVPSDWFSIAPVKPSIRLSAETVCGKLKMSKKRIKHKLNSTFFFKFISSFHKNFDTAFEAL